jgi:hypothetical protein
MARLGDISITATGRRMVIRNGKRTWAYPGEALMPSYLVNTRTNRKFEIVKFDRVKNILTLKGETGGQFEEPYDKARLKELGYTYVQQDNEQQDA